MAFVGNASTGWSHRPEGGDREDHCACQQAGDEVSPKPAIFLQLVFEDFAMLIVLSERRFMQRDSWLWLWQRRERESGDGRGQSHQQTQRWQKLVHLSLGLTRIIQLLMPQGFDRIHQRRTTSGIDSEDDANPDRNAEGHQD